MNRLCLIVAIALSMALSACAHHAVRESRVQMSYVSFQTLDEAQPRAEAGVLRLPVGIDHRVPAVVIVHGSAGVDSRGSLYAADLNDACEFLRLGVQCSSELLDRGNQTAVYFRCRSNVHRTAIVSYKES